MKSKSGSIDMELGKGGRMESSRGFTKSFRANYSRTEPRKIGNVAIIASMLLSLCILSLVKARYCPSSSVKSQAPLQIHEHIGSDVKTVTDENIEDEDQEENVVNTVVDTSEPICSETSRRSDTCEARGDIRVQGSTHTIYIHPSSTSQQEWKIKPYARKGDVVALATVKEWTLKPPSDHQPPPACTTNHSTPAVIFSLGGFIGNLFHDFTDVLVPLFITSHQFDGEVQFLVADSKSWWVNKFILILKHLSKYDVIDVDSDRESVRCFPRVIIGPSFHKELGVDSSKTPNGYSVLDFKKLLRRSLGLQRSNAMTEGIDGEVRRHPRLLIISRKHSRGFVNERGMVAMATSLGFDVRIGEPDMNTDMSKFARLVNSADVMIGVHGAGLTNMVFLPEGAVMIQVIPLGGLEWLARNSFEKPSKEMEVKYLEYMIQADESTLIEQYPRDHPVLKDPSTVHKQGWDALKSVYLDKQNVRPHLGRLRSTLMEALKSLPHTS